MQLAISEILPASPLHVFRISDFMRRIAVLALHARRMGQLASVLIRCATEAPRPRQSSNQTHWNSCCAALHLRYIVMGPSMAIALDAREVT